MQLLSLAPLLVLEQALQQLLALDEQSAGRLQQLAGKRLRVTLQELGRPLTVTVTAEGLLLSLQHEADDQVDCHIITRLAVLPELRDSANITRLIKADALDIEGDPILAQQLSKLLTDLDIDWEARLAEWLGDVPAYWLLQAWQRSQRWWQAQREAQQTWLAEVLIEEKQLLLGRTEYQHFKDQVQALRARLDKLERALS